MEDIPSSSDEMIDDGDLSEDEDDELNQDERLEATSVPESRSRKTLCRIPHHGSGERESSREKIAKRKGSSPWSRRAKILKMSRERTGQTQMLGTASEAHLDNQLSDLVSIRAFSSRSIAYPNSLQMASSATSNALPDLFRPTTYGYDWSNDQYEWQPGFLRQMPWLKPIFDSIFSQTAGANFPA
ncbi:MAG: hypothetical protein Q9197_003916, partial [Variospora fuerteventurae]